MYKAFNFAHAGNLIDDVDGVFAEALTNSFHPPKKKKNKYTQTHIVISCWNDIASLSLSFLSHVGWKDR